MKTYRTNGAVGALLDEYERALGDLKTVVETITDEELKTIVDTETEDEDCRSIQTILAHVVGAGYNYAIRIRLHQGETWEYTEKIKLATAADYLVALDGMFSFNEKLFADYPNLVLEELDNSKKMVTRWGQMFDIDQLMEHAIVHILRHRRQIERFLLRLRG